LPEKTKTHKKTKNELESAVFRGSACNPSWKH